MITADRALTNAVDILETDGWTVGAFKCDEGKRCAIGALRAAVFGTEYPGGGTYGKDKGKGHVYMTALRALARTINPKIDEAIEERKRDRASRWVTGWTTSMEMGVLEDEVIGYNDGRVDNANGRRAVLNRFRKAAEVLSK